MITNDGAKSRREPLPWNEFEAQFLGNAKWVEKYNFGIHTCSQSGKIIWPFSKAYCGTATWEGPGSIVMETKWMNGATFTYLRLTGKV